MRSRFAASADDSSDDYFGNLTHDFSANAAGDGSSSALPSFSAWAGAFNEHNWGTPIPVSALTGEAQEAMAAQSGPVTVVPVSVGTGFTINLLYDANAMAAPQSFRDTIQQAANVLAASITDPITVNIVISYTGTGGGAAAGPSGGLLEPYTLVRSDLIASASPGDTIFNTLPTGTSIQGQSQVAVWNAQLKLWGLLSPTDTGVDGNATFATDIAPNLLLGVALHELTHAMGRVPYGPPYGPQPDIFDLFRFTSSGVRLIDGAATAPAAYFSLDGGVTKLADYGRTSDSSDFLNSGIQGPNDPFNEFYSGMTLQKLTTLDLQQMDALGFHLKSNAPTIGPTADILWFNSATGQFTVWDSTGTTFTPNVYVGSVGPGWTLAGTGDFNGDGKTDLIWQNGVSFTEWQSAGNGFTPNVVTGGASGGWHIVGTGDFNGDGKSDLIWQNGATITEWQSTGTGFTPNVYVGNVSWTLVATGDFNGDGKTDLIWQGANAFSEWQSTGNGFTPNVLTGGAGGGWSIVGAGDFNADGKSDLIWQNGATFTEWQSTGNGFTQNVYVGNLGSAGWTLVGTGDFNGDGKSDLLWFNASAQKFSEWVSTGNGFTPNVYVGSGGGGGWALVGDANFTTTQSGQSMGVVAQQTASNAWDGANDNFAFNLASGVHTASVAPHSGLSLADISAQFAHADALQSLLAGAVDGGHAPGIDPTTHDGAEAGSGQNPALDPNNFMHHSYLLG